MSFYAARMRPRLLTLSARASAWTQAHMSRYMRILMVCVLTGVLAGVGAWVMKSLIGLIGSLITGRMRLSGWNWVLFAGPVLGMALTGVLTRRVWKRNVARGTEKLRHYLADEDYDLPHQIGYEPVVGCAVTIGCGCSAGAEGPIAYAGAAIGSNVARFFGLGRETVRVMIACGAGAGIAAIFKAPLGGFFFTLEVLGVALSTLTVIMLVVCCLIAAFTVFTITGFRPEVEWVRQVTEYSYAQIPLWLLIGLLVGIYCIWYNETGMEARRRSIAIRTPWVRNVATGALMGAMILFLPTLYGEGYGSITQFLAGRFDAIAEYSPFQGCMGAWTVPVMLGLILLVKGIVVQLTNSGGGVAGSFAPTLFAGCMAGMLIWYGMEAVGIHMPAEQVAYISMAGAMSGMIGAPLMGTFITVEITQTYALLLPCAVVAFVSYMVVQGFERIHIRRPHIVQGPK